MSIADCSKIFFTLLKFRFCEGISLQECHNFLGNHHLRFVLCQSNLWWLFFHIRPSIGMLEMEFERFFLEFLFGRSDSHHAVRHVQKPKNVYILRHALPSTTHESMEVFFM